jgi:predicted N-acyltransferase
VRFRALHGPDMGEEDWAFFYRCHERTYLEHGNAPYLSPGFFEAMARQMPEAWLMFIAERDGRPIACSLIALDARAAQLSASGQPRPDRMRQPPQGTAYGRYWGALERVDCLHFEACYYQPIAWCMERGIAHFEGGAQGEHKMARALLPVVTPSAHWIAHPAFADAISRFLDREGEGMAGYLQELQAHSPLRQG